MKIRYPRCNFITSAAELEGKLPGANRALPKYNYVWFNYITSVVKNRDTRVKNLGTQP
jgi:hypothetical protein